MLFFFTDSNLVILISSFASNGCFRVMLDGKYLQKVSSQSWISSRLHSWSYIFLFLLYIHDLSDDICNNAIYADNTTLYSKCDKASDLWQQLKLKGDICQEEMKENRKEYFKRLRETLKSKLNAKHVFQAINTWLVSTVQYSAGIIEWMKKKVKEMDQKTKIITMHDGLHPRSNIEWLYLQRS